MEENKQLTTRITGSTRVCRNLHVIISWLSCLAYEGKEIVSRKNEINQKQIGAATLAPAPPLAVLLISNVPVRSP